MKILEKDYLQHYGVLGMRWGIRKNSEISGSQSGTTNKKYSIDKEGRISIEKGYILQRVYNKNKQESGETGTNYFSFTKKDNDTYLAMMGAGAYSKIGFIRNLASNTISRLSAKEPLKSPSREEAFNILNQSYKEVGKKGFSGDFKKRGAFDWYVQQNHDIVMNRNSPHFKAFKKNLLKRGFNILLDETDTGILSELPILVLDCGRSLKKITINEFSKESLDNARKMVLKQDLNRTLDEMLKEENK